MECESVATLIEIRLAENQQVRGSMRFASRVLVICILGASGVPAAFAKKKEVPKAPLPIVVQTAKTAFITNGGGTPLAFDEFYSQIKQWGRFQLAASPADADIVIELKYFVEDKGERTGSTYNSYTKQTQIYSYGVTDPQLILNIYDAKTRALLWSTTDHRRLARRKSNQEKETINSADRLVHDLQERKAVPIGVSN